jgi:hypothetical protein
VTPIGGKFVKVSTNVFHNPQGKDHPWRTMNQALHVQGSMLSVQARYADGSAKFWSATAGWQLIGSLNAGMVLGHRRFTLTVNCSIVMHTSRDP